MNKKQISIQLNSNQVSIEQAAEQWVRILLIHLRLKKQQRKLLSLERNKYE